MTNTQPYQPHMTTVKLHGILEEKYFPSCSLQLDTNKPIEVFRSLSIQLDGFEDLLSLYDFEVLKLNLNTNESEKLDMTDVICSYDHPYELHITPIAQGAGGDSGAVGKIILGGAIIALSYGAASGAVASGWAGSTGVSIFGSAVTFGDTALFGLSLVLAGFAGLLSPVNDVNDYSSREQTQNFLYNGGLNATEEGNIVPVVYGRVITGSVVISGGVRTEQILDGSDSDEITNPYSPKFGIPNNA